MKNKINYCSDVDMSKININCCGNEIVSIHEVAPIESDLLDVTLYFMQTEVRKKIVKSMLVDYCIYNQSFQVETFMNPKEKSHE